MPFARKDEVLIRVFASTVSAADYRVATGRKGSVVVRMASAAPNVAGAE